MSAYFKKKYTVPLRYSIDMNRQMICLSCKLSYKYIKFVKNCVLFCFDFDPKLPTGLEHCSPNTLCTDVIFK